MTDTGDAENWPRTVAILHEGRPDPGGLSQSFAEGFQAHGCQVDLLTRQESWPRSYDLVLGYGPSTWEGSLLPTAERLRAFDPSTRPFFYWWFIECIPSPKIPGRAALGAARLRLAMDRGLGRTTGLRKVLRRGFRLQILGELDRFRALGVLDGLAVTSASRADYLAQLGFKSIIVPIGYEAELHGRDLAHTRNIDVGFLGSMDSSRRGRRLARICEALAQRGIDVVIRDNLYGEARTQFLNRTKIILNVFRSPYDYYGLRFMFCAANKALMISEPVVDKRPFIPGKHFVARPIAEIADSVAHYLAHEDERLAMVDSAYEIVHRSYTTAEVAGHMLAHARRLRMSG